MARKLVEVKPERNGRSSSSTPIVLGLMAAVSLTVDPVELQKLDTEVMFDVSAKTLNSINVLAGWVVRNGAAVKPASKEGGDLALHMDELKLLAHVPQWLVNHDNADCWLALSKSAGSEIRITRVAMDTLVSELHQRRASHPTTAGLLHDRLTVESWAKAFVTMAFSQAKLDRKLGKQGLYLDSLLPLPPETEQPTV